MKNKARGNLPKMIFFLKKLVKAILPYGVIVLCRIIRSRIKNRNRKLLKNICCSPRRETQNGQFIVTLTSHGRRITSKAPYAIQSLFAQSQPPDRIILWLGNGTKVPPSLKKWEKYGLEIRFCEDIRSYTKLIPALIAFPDNILVTADDDIYYHPDWFKRLKKSYELAPEKIHCHRAHEICLDEKKNIIPYDEWRGCVRTIEQPQRIFPTGVGGILYPPRSFSDEVLNIEKFRRLAPTADDVWFWAMAKLNGKNYVIVKDGIRNLESIGLNDENLSFINVINMKNDEQIRNIITEYPAVYMSIL
jgi:hypothetical protein